MRRALPLILILICITAAIVTYSPHIAFPLPFHTDEWTHIGFAVSMNQTGHVVHQWPYFKESPEAGTDLEFGFHMLVLGLSYFSQIRPEHIAVIMPAVFSVITVISTFFLVRYLFDEFSAIFATLFVFTIKTNVTTLGPMFFVPVTACIPLLPVLIYLILDSFERSDINLFVLTTFFFAGTTLVHPTTTLMLLIPFGIYLLLRYRLLLKNKKIVALAILALIAIFMFFTRNFLTDPAQLFEFIENRFITPGTDPNNIVIHFYLPVFIGIPLTALGMLGFYRAFETKKKQALILPLLLVFNVILLFMFYNNNISYIVPYRRAVVYAALFMSILAGEGIAYPLLMIFRRLPTHRIIAVFLIAIIVLSFLGYQVYTTTKYTKLFYKDIGPGDYEKIKLLEGIADNSVIQCMPEVCHTVYPVTGKHTVSSLIGWEDRQKDSKLFFESGCDFRQGLIKKYGITHVYYNLPINCTFLENIAPNIYKVNSL